MNLSASKYPLSVISRMKASLALCLNSLNSNGLSPSMCHSCIGHMTQASTGSLLACLVAFHFAFLGSVQYSRASLTCQSGDGRPLTGVSGRRDLSYMHWRPPSVHLLQDGCVSSHLIRR